MKYEKAKSLAIQTAHLFLEHESEEDSIVGALGEMGLSNLEARKQHAFVQPILWQFW